MRRETSSNPNGSARGAFTLVEMLVVIAVMSILAAMIFPIGAALTRVKIKSVTSTDLQMLQTAIEDYKAKVGHYPPDNGTNHFVHQLYYELVGATYAKLPTGKPDPTTFQTLNDLTLPVNTLVNTLAQPNSLGLVNTQVPVKGLANFVTAMNPEEGSTLANYLSKLRPNQIQTDANGLRFLASTFQWPINRFTFAANSGYLNNYCLWRYNSYNPPHNPGSFDLWVDVLMDGKTYRFSNWSKEPVVVTTPDE